ncbi:carbohydrate ABC transporter permease [Paenibacillus koleovorans]|uniref:carbohydrate ABC transporter permease n=1 Tax=Paenibacillus koleovorans TaxID=121608 RepID=UPI000FD79E33|nr:carbohydrate ABC transporter permease [Paenibacillus koleovorans]
MVNFDRTPMDRLVDGLIYFSLGLFALMTLFPLYYVFVVSITPYTEVVRHGGFVIFPSQWTWSAYEEILSSQRIPRALGVTVLVTTVGTLMNLVFTMLVAYPLSKKFVPGRNGFLIAIVFTMLFSGGIIPTYLIVRAVGLYDSFWALIIPSLVSTFYMLIMKTYFENLPSELEDAAKVDGCGDVSTLFRLVLPLSAPIVATLGLFYGVGHWNSFFPAIMYLSDRNWHPIQVVLRNMIQSPNVSQELMSTDIASLTQLPPETVKMATVVLAIIPIILIYPFLQKYFVKGMLIGSVKG